MAEDMSNTNKDINELHQTIGKKAPSANDIGEQEAVDKEWESLKDDTPAATQDKAFEELEKKYNELDDQYKRLWADQQNMMQRFQKERQDNAKYAAVPTIEAVLPALDNFEFAKKSLNEETKFEDIIKSIDMLREQLLMSLKSVGLEEVATNIAFDPQLHEAIANVPNPEIDEGTIVDVAKKGYKLKDRVIRVASVVVSTKE